MIFLQQLPLLVHLDKNELEAIANSMEKHSYVKNEQVFRAGDPANRLYIVFDGEVQMFKSSADGKTHTLRIMQKNDLIGEVPIFEGGAYPASCTTLTATVLYSISRTNFLALIQQDPKIALTMLGLQARRLREFTIKIEQLTLQKTEQMLADLFIQKASNINNNQANVALKDMGVQNLANYLGVTRESVSRIISKWLKEKLISKQQRNIIIQDFNALEKIRFQQQI